MKNKFRFSILLFILIAFIGFTCNSSKNQEDKSEKKGLRIVSLAPSLTKELTDLGMTSSIVGATSYCEVASSNKDLIIGTATEVNLEKVLLLKPDMVFATALTSPNTIKSLENNGIKVYMCPKMKSFEVMCNHFRELGKLTGKEKQADSIINASRQTIDSLRKTINLKPVKQKVFFQIGANPLFSVIPNTYMNDLITFAGAENIAADFTQGTITRESVLKQNPDIIFIVTMGIVGDQEKQTWESYRELNAFKNKKIFIIDAEMACTPTVIYFTKTFEQIIQLMYF